MLIDCGIEGTGFGLILAGAGHAAADEHRSRTLGIVTAARSAGQVIGPPATEFLLGGYGRPPIADPR